MDAPSSLDRLAIALLPIVAAPPQTSAEPSPWSSLATCALAPSPVDLASARRRLPRPMDPLELVCRRRVKSTGRPPLPHPAATRVEDPAAPRCATSRPPCSGIEHEQRAPPMPARRWIWNVPRPRSTLSPRQFHAWAELAARSPAGPCAPCVASAKAQPSRGPGERQPPYAYDLPGRLDSQPPKPPPLRCHVGLAHEVRPPAHCYVLPIALRLFIISCAHAPVSAQFQIRPVLFFFPSACDFNIIPGLSVFTVLPLDFHAFNN